MLMPGAGAAVVTAAGAGAAITNVFIAKGSLFD